MKEIKRVEDFHSGEIKCLRCGKDLELHWNGGELDEVDCCGFLYILEHTRVDLVVYDLSSKKED